LTAGAVRFLKVIGFIMFWSFYQVLYKSIPPQVSQAVLLIAWNQFEVSE